MAFIEIKSPKGTFFFRGATPQSAFAGFQKQVGGGGTFKNISQQAFTSGLARFGFSPSGARISKPAARPAARPKAKAVKKGPSARQRAATATAKKEAAFRAKQAKESKAFELKFEQFRTGLEPLDVLRKRLGIELGIPGLQAQLDPLQQRALRLGQLQLDLPETVGALTRGQGEARRKLLETSKGAELSRQLRDVAISQEFFAGQLTGARGELTEQLGVTVEQRDFDLRAFGQQADLLNTRLAREVKGYSTQLQREFEAIIGDIERAEDLRDQDVQRAFELAKLETAARLEAQNIRLRSGLGGGDGAPKETNAREQQAQSALRQLGQFIGGGTSKQAIDVATKGFASRFPEFSEDFFELAKRLTGGSVGGGDGYKGL